MLQLLILLLTVLVTSGTECPTMCICKHLPREVVPTNYLYFTVVKCDGFSSMNNATISNLTRILEVSHLDDTNFSELVQTLSESDLPELNTVLLRHSIVSNFSELLLNIPAEQIQFLTLSHNNLTVIPELTDNLSVVSLDLTGNQITRLSSYHMLQTIRTLEFFNLSANYIRTIEPDSFQNLTTLKVLDLSQNNLSSFDDDTLWDSLVSLQYLNLSHNHIEFLSDNCFSSLVKLQQLDVSWNNLARMAAGSLQLPNLARLLLAGNPRLGSAHEVLVGVCQRLHTVDASGIGLKQVPVVFTHSVRTLKLSHNSITTITSGELDAYPLLQFLDFTSNDIYSIEEDSMGRLEFLSVLHLSDNKLRSIPRSFPEELRVLHLERNVIKKLSREDLYGLPKLEVLLLNNNKITVVEGGAFRYLNSLVTLDLSGNSIKALYPGSLSGPTALQILRMSDIDTVSPAEDVSFPLSAPDHLVILDLSGSSGLARQLLADTAALAASRELQELDISGAELEFIRADLLHFLPQLRIMHIKDNRLNCSNLQWLAAWMRRQDQAEYRYITCASPPELWGTPLLDLQYGENSPIKQINHEKGPDFQGTINHQREASAAEKSGPLRKYVTQRTTDTSTLIINYLVNSSVNSTTTPIIDKNILKNDASNAIYLTPIHGNEVNRDLTPKYSTKATYGSKLFRANDDSEEGKVTKQKKGTVKSVNKVLVSSAETGLSSLIPVSNDQNENFATKETANNQAGYAKTVNPTNYGYLAQHTKLTANWLHGELNKTQRLPNPTPNERIVNDTSSFTRNQKVKVGMQPLNDVNMTDNASEWNASTVKTFMYQHKESPTRLFHIGMMLLLIGVLCGAVTLVTVAARCNNRNRWHDRNEDAEDIPVASISSITELW